MLAICRIAPIEEVEKIKEKITYVKCFCEDTDRLSETAVEYFDKALYDLDIVIKELSQNFDE